MPCQENEKLRFNLIEKYAPNKDEIDHHIPLPLITDFSIRVAGDWKLKRKMMQYKNT